MVHGHKFEVEQQPWSTVVLSSHYNEQKRKKQHYKEQTLNDGMASNHFAAAAHDLVTMATLEEGEPMGSY